MSTDTTVIGLAIIGILVFALAIGLRSWRTWMLGYCFIALAVIVFGCSKWQEQRVSAQHAEVR